VLGQEPAEKSAGAAGGEEHPQGEMAGVAGGTRMVADDWEDDWEDEWGDEWEDDPDERHRVCAEIRQANAKVTAWIQQTKDWEDALARNLSCTQQVVGLEHGNDTVGVQTVKGDVKVGEELGGTDDEIEEDAQAHARKARACAWNDALARTYTHSEDWASMATYAGKTSRDQARTGVSGSAGAAAAAAGFADAAAQHCRSLQPAKGGEDHGEERGRQQTSQATRGVEMLERALAGYSEALDEHQRSHAIWVKRCASRVLNASSLPTKSVRSAEQLAAEQLAAMVSRSATESATASSNACTVSATLFRGWGRGGGPCGEGQREGGREGETSFIDNHEATEGL
jgi:hypothetical protein